MRSCAECGLRYPAGESFCAADGSPIVENDDELLGETLGKYRILRLLGAGGMGRVYLARNPQIDSRVAVKVLSAQAASDKELVQRFFREAQLVNKIRHESIVNVFDLDELPDGRPYIIMECLEGQPLSAVIAQGPMELARVGKIAIEILDALQAAHQAGVVHRDLKPDNVFLTPQGHVKLLDFGIAKLMPSYDASAVLSTKTGVVMGTPGYMAPEQVLGQEASPATDLYATGSILYESLTGQLAFRGQSLYELFSRIVQEAPRPPAEIRSELAGPFEALILRAMAKNPSERYSSAREMAEVIAGVLAGQNHPSLQAPLPVGWSKDPAVAATVFATAPSGVLTNAPQAKVRSKRIYVVAAACALLLAGGLAALLVADAPTNAEGGQTDPVAVLDVKADAGGAARSAAEVVPGKSVALAVDAGVQAKPRLPRKPSKAPTSAASLAEVVDAGRKSTGGVTLLETGELYKDKQIRMRPNFDTAAFDGVAFLPKARALAKRIYSDAYLTTFDIEGVGPAGTANLKRHKLEATYKFLSPSHAKRSAPLGIEEDRPCWIYVEVDREGVTARIVESDECKDKARPNPRCSLQKVWQRAVELGAPATGAVAGIDYLWDGWFFSIDALNFTESIPDDC